MKRVFISYNHKEHHKISGAISFLKKEMPELEEAEIWDSIFSLSAEVVKIREEIQKRIESSDVFVLFWTKATPESGWCFYELGFASTSEMPVIIVIEPGAPELPDILSKFKTIEMES